MIKIGVDANGGDFGVETTVPAAMKAISMFDDIEIVLYGDENKIKPLLTNSERISIVHTEKTLSMGEKDPMRAVRREKDSSLCMAMYAAKNNEVERGYFLTRYYATRNYNTTFYETCLSDKAIVVTVEDNSLSFNDLYDTSNNADNPNTYNPNLRALNSRA